MTNNVKLLRCVKLTKYYKCNNVMIQVLNQITLNVQHNEMVAVVGESGSGKSTLLNLLSGLDQPTAGEVFFEGNLLKNLSDKKLSSIRNKRLGFIHQFHHLLSDFNILENVAMPLLISGNNFCQSKKRAEYMLELVGLKNRMHHYPTELSGGENQRVAVVRAIINNPVLILADEPTGNLDKKNSNNIFRLLKKLNVCYGISFIITTHDLNLTKLCHRTLELFRGQIIV